MGARSFTSLNDRLPNSRADKPSKRKAVLSGSTAPKADAVRIRLDHRTTITCRPQSIAFWRARYPNLTML
jgi:hypothetical protein